MADGQDRDITVSRLVDAPNGIVWLAMTEARHLTHWWGPRGCTISVLELDVRPGGAWTYIMHVPGGFSFTNRSRFTEVVEPGRLVYVNGRGPQGGTSSDFDTILTAAPVGGGKTDVTIRMVFPSRFLRDQFARRADAVVRGNQILDRLASYLPKVGAGLAQALD